MTDILNGDFGTGDLSNWTTTNNNIETVPSVSSSSAHFGNYGVRFTVDALDYGVPTIGWFSFTEVVADNLPTSCEGWATAWCPGANTQWDYDHMILDAGGLSGNYSVTDCVYGANGSHGGCSYCKMVKVIVTQFAPWPNRYKGDISLESDMVTLDPLLLGSVSFWYRLVSTTGQDAGDVTVYLDDFSYGLTELLKINMKDTPGGWINVNISADTFYFSGIGGIKITGQADSTDPGHIMVVDFSEFNFNPPTNGMPTISMHRRGIGTSTHGGMDAWGP